MSEITLEPLGTREKRRAAKRERHHHTHTLTFLFLPSSALPSRTAAAAVVNRDSRRGAAARMDGRPKQQNRSVRPDLICLLLKELLDVVKL